jgi:hypothetical protein
MPVPVQELPLFWQFAVSRRVTVETKCEGSRCPFGASFIARTARYRDGTISFCCLGRSLQLQVVVPALTRT